MSDDDFPEVGYIQLRQASTYTPRDIRWGWAGRAPVGEITLICGREGIGKTLLLAWLAAQLSKGNLPGAFRGKSRDVLMVTREDSWDHTIVPRLMAASANLDRVHNVVAGNGGLILPRDCDELMKAAQSVNAAAVMFDPILSCIDEKLSPNQPHQLRQALEPLKASAEDAGVMVLALAHFNKAKDGDLLSKVPGSRAWVEVARAVILMGRDQDTGEHIMQQAKNNLGRLDLPNMEYHINTRLLRLNDGRKIEMPRLDWTGETNKTVEEIASDKRRGTYSENYQKVVDCVVNAGRAVPIAYVIDMLPDVKESVIRKYLPRAVERKDLVKVKDGHYRAPAG